MFRRYHRHGLTGYEIPCGSGLISFYSFGQDVRENDVQHRHCVPEGRESKFMLIKIEINEYNTIYFFYMTYTNSVERKLGFIKEEKKKELIAYFDSS